ncbi:thiamine pyrophosphate-binding protein, partial [Nostocoides japonicum]|uniref:thiamine pyrophosphate-binding protein n=1 Tax=Nostocoides japonicum TaxID=99481 RepID=UPI00065BB645
MTPSIAAACAAVEALVASGVRDVVLCPGSRSAPLGYAVRAAERAGRLRLQVRVDERSAGFLALGLAKLGGPPAAVVTTSGTAVANLHPAVLEAHHATVPLLLLTADRPAALRGAGANQTTVQPGIYGPSTRYAVDLAPGDDVASAVGTAVARARGEWGALLGTAGDRSEDGLDVAAVGDGSAAVAPGPVHVNLQLVEPLVPADADDLDAWAAGLAEGTSRLTDAERHPSAVGAFPGSETVGTLVPPDGERLGSTGDLGLPARTLLLLGDLPERDVADAVLEWASTRAYPVLAEPFGRHPRPGVVPHGVVVAADAGFVDAHPPECVLVVGRLTLSRSIARLTRRRDVRLAVASAAGQPWRPPGRSAEVIDLLPSVGVARRDGMARAFEGVGGAHGGECSPRPDHSADHAAP